MNLRDTPAKIGTHQIFLHRRCRSTRLLLRMDFFTLFFARGDCTNITEVCLVLTSLRHDLSTWKLEPVESEKAGKTVWKNWRFLWRAFLSFSGMDGKKVAIFDPDLPVFTMVL